MKEIWKDVAGYVGHYKISNLGRVKSLPGKWKFKTAIILKPSVIKGYETVGLSKNGERKPWRINRIVAFTFHGPPPKGKPFALHNDNNTRNNRPNNIRWGSPQDNMDDKVNRGHHCGEWLNRKLKNQDIIAIRLLLKKGVTQVKIAKQFSVNQTTISCIKLRKIWTHV